MKIPQTIGVRFARAQMLVGAGIRHLWPLLTVQFADGLESLLSSWLIEISQEERDPAPIYLLPHEKHTNPAVR